MAIIYATVKIVLHDVGIDNGDDPIESEQQAKDLVKDVMYDFLTSEGLNGIEIDSKTEYDKDEEEEESED